MTEPAKLSGRCGTCMFFIPKSTTTAGVRSGECRLGCWPSPLAETATCASHRAIGSAPRPVAKARQSPARSAPVAPARAPAFVLPQEIGIDMDQEEFRNVLRAILRDELGVGELELGDRWQGGELVMVPGKAGTQEKRVPIDNLFRKIVLIREKLRVLEQRINNHEKLGDDDRLQLQQYITQCYGSLTTFNVLFRNKDDQFSGQAGKDD